MTPKMMNILDTNFKDDSPLNTVKRIKEILQTYGIETAEQWTESGVPYCYSLRVSVFGTEFGVNGKGVTEELALASAYGELMERMQLGKIFRGDLQKDSGLDVPGSCDAYSTVQELLSKNKKWYTMLAENAAFQTGVAITEEEILDQYQDENGKISVTSFYCANKRSMESLPSSLLTPVYTTNGCAAGNTPEEAIVQAISEIVERKFSDRVLMEGISVPDIPEDTLRSCEVAYEIITYLRSQNFKVVIKDCSLGTKFPVVCVCLIDQKTGKYHTHFGAYPKFEIALQRTLTEAFQGKNIQKVASIEKFATQKDKILDTANLLNQLIYGVSEKKPEFFVDTAEFRGITCGFSGTNNRQLLKECIDFITEQGYDVLIRDFSCLGFPTYQVIIPGYSEVCVYRIVPEHNDARYRKYRKAVLRNPAKATTEEIMGFYANMAQAAKKRRSDGSFSRQTNLPLRFSKAEERFLMNATLAYLNYTLGQKGQTVIFIEKMLAEAVEKDEEKLICIKRYLTLSYEYEDQDKVRKILEYFHTPETVSWLYNAVAEKKNLLDEFVLHCDMKCDASCMLLDVCMKKQTNALTKLIKEKQNELNRTVLEQQLNELLQ